VLTSELPVEDFLFSAGGGFLFGAVAGYSIKKVMKIAAVVIGLLVVGLTYLSYRGWVDVKWVRWRMHQEAHQHNLHHIHLLLRYQGYQ
jgi:uncharacterized membrane protein (Fun14 family)